MPDHGDGLAAELEQARAERDQAREDLAKARATIERVRAAVAELVSPTDLAILRDALYGDGGARAWTTLPGHVASAPSGAEVMCSALSDQLRQMQAERDEARATIARARALVGRLDDVGEPYWTLEDGEILAELREALDGDAPTEAGSELARPVPAASGVGEYAAGGPCQSAPTIGETGCALAIPTRRPGRITAAEVAIPDLSEAERAAWTAAAEGEVPDLRTAEQWQADDPIRILDADGWRDLPWDTPISRDEYLRRRDMCTIRGPVGTHIHGPAAEGPTVTIKVRWDGSGSLKDALVAAMRSKLDARPDPMPTAGTEPICAPCREGRHLDCDGDDQAPAWRCGCSCVAVGEVRDA